MDSVGNWVSSPKTCWKSLGRKSFSPSEGNQSCSETTSVTLTQTSQCCWYYFVNLHIQKDDPHFTGFHVNDLSTWNFLKFYTLLWRQNVSVHVFGNLFPEILLVSGQWMKSALVATITGGWFSCRDFWHKSSCLFSFTDWTRLRTWVFIFHFLDSFPWLDSSLWIVWITLYDCLVGSPN